MNNSYKIVFDPDLWTDYTQNKPQQDISTQNYNSAQILIPDQQIIQKNSPAKYTINQTEYDDIQENQTLKTKNKYTQEAISKQEITQIIDEKINNIKVYVLESDITQAQNSIKSVVELASF